MPEMKRNAPTITSKKTASAARAFVLLFLIFAGVGAGSTESTLAQDRRFQKLGVNLDPWAESQIRFWRRVYTEFNQGDYLVHDSINLAHLYRVEKSASGAGAGKGIEGKAPFSSDFASERGTFDASASGERRGF